MPSLLRLTASSALATLLLLSLGAQAQVYRWTDTNGKVHYSDLPPTDTKAETRRLTDSKVDVDKLPFEAREAARKFPLTLYTTPECGDPCGNARSFLQQRKAPFSEKSVKSAEELEAMKRATSQTEPKAPTLMVGNKPISGFEAGSWGSALDAAGYPK